MPLRTTNLKPGDILLYNSSNIVARLICAFDDAEVSHAGLYLGNGVVGEALIVGNPGLNRNPLAESVKGSNWIEAARLHANVDFQPVLARADWHLDLNNRYAYEQVLMLAVILLTRKIDDDNWLVRQIADRTFTGCANLLDLWQLENREPMICSEFVFRAYDEALPDARDAYTIEIREQGSGRPRRMISRRRRARIFGSAPPAESPTVHPDSLLAKLADEPARLMTFPEKAAGPSTAEEIEAAIDAPGREYLGEEPAFRTRVGESGAAAETSKAAVEAAAADFASALMRASRHFATSESPDANLSLKATDADSVEQLKQVVADFVTPGDLHRSPSISIAGRLELEGMLQ